MALKSLYTIVFPPEPFRVGFHQTVYTVIESAGSVEVCVSLTHPRRDIIHDEQVTVLVFHNDSSIYVPSNPRFASEQPFTSIIVFDC